MTDFIIIASGLVGALGASVLSQFFFPKPKSFSAEELGHMAFALAGLIVGVVVGDLLIIQNFF